MTEFEPLKFFSKNRKTNDDVIFPVSILNFAGSKPKSRSRPILEKFCSLGQVGLGNSPACNNHFKFLLAI